MLRQMSITLCLLVRRCMLEGAQVQYRARCKTRLKIKLQACVLVHAGQRACMNTWLLVRALHSPVPWAMPSAAVHWTSRLLTAHAMFRSTVLDQQMNDAAHHEDKCLLEARCEGMLGGDESTSGYTLKLVPQSV